jgi:hypothetical protein
MMYQSNARNARTYDRLPWGTYVAGFLVTVRQSLLQAAASESFQAWGGSVITHFLLSIPPPQLYSIHPWINYVGVHLFLTLLFTLLPPVRPKYPPLSSEANPVWCQLLRPAVLDTLSPIPDALVRTASLTNALRTLSTHPSISPALSDSWFTHVVVGAVASAGGGTLAGTLK